MEVDDARSEGVEGGGDRGPLARVLPPAVPPDPRERRVVGRRASPSGPTSRRATPLLPRPPPAARARPTSASTTCACPRSAQAQADLARAYGIDGFCYYHYWFDGRRLLERPFDEVLALGRARLPVLPVLGERDLDARLGRQDERGAAVRQTYSPDDDLAHIRWLGRGVRRPALHPDRRQAAVPRLPRRRTCPIRVATTERWRAEAQRLGLGELYLCSMQTGPGARVDPPRRSASTPRCSSRRSTTSFAPARPQRRRARRAEYLRGRAARRRAHRIVRLRRGGRRTTSPCRRRRYTLYPCVSPGFDNSPRRPTAARPSSPGRRPSAYERWLRDGDRALPPPSPEENLVFVNAWNEWAEGNHLEPRPAVGHALPRGARAELASSAGGPMTDASRARRRRRRRGLESSRSTCRSSTRSPRTTSGGGRASPSGRTSPGRGRSFRGHDQPKLPGAARLLRPAARRDARGTGGARRASTASRPSATGTTGSPGGGCSSGRSRRCSTSGEPDFPFCLGWANQHWTTIWTGGTAACSSSRRIPGPDDHERHFDAAAPGVRGPALPPRRRPAAVPRVPAERPARRATRSPTSGGALAERAGLPGLYLVGETKNGWRAAATASTPRCTRGCTTSIPAPRCRDGSGPRLDRALRRRPKTYPVRRPRRDAAPAEPPAASASSRWSCRTGTARRASGATASC